MKSIDYITLRVGLKFIVLFKNDFIDDDPEKTMNYLYHILSILYDEEYFDIKYQVHDFI